MNTFSNIISPLDQFNITGLLNINLLNILNISLTNIGFYLTTSLVVIVIISVLSTNYNKLVSNQ